jgi:hypothetical protein
MKKIKQILFTCLLLLSITIQAQVKIGDNPASVGASSLLELESTNKALVLTRVANTASVTSPANGMMIYDLSLSCVRVYENGSWSACFSGPTTVHVSTTSCGFSGTYKPTYALSGATFAVTLKNDSTIGVATIGFHTSDLVLSGVTGYTVSGVSPATLTLNPGQSGTVTYTLSGTTPTSGTLTGSWTKLSASCANTQAIVYDPTATVVGPGTGADNQYHTVLLSNRGPYAARSISIMASTYLDGSISLHGDLKEAELNTADVVVYSTAGITTLGAAHGSIADNAYHTVICPTGRVVTGFEVYASTYLDNRVKLQCTALNPGFATEVGDGVIDAVGASGSLDNTLHVTACPPNQFIKGVRMYASSYLDDIGGLYCTSITP